MVATALASECDITAVIREGLAARKSDTVTQTVIPGQGHNQLRHWYYSAGTRITAGPDRPGQGTTRGARAATLNGWAVISVRD